MLPHKPAVAGCSGERLCGRSAAAAAVAAGRASFLWRGLAQLLPRLACLPARPLAVHAYLPAEASFGFADELRRRSSGAAAASLMLSHWERLQVGGRALALPAQHPVAGSILFKRKGGASCYKVMKTRLLPVPRCGQADCRLSARAGSIQARRAGQANNPAELPPLPVRSTACIVLDYTTLQALKSTESAGLVGLC